MECFALPRTLAGDRNIRTEIEGLLAIGEEGHKALWTASASFARDLLGRGERKPVDKDVKQFTRQMSASPSYWSTLESRFHDILGGINIGLESAEVRRRWLVGVRNALSDAWTRHRVSVSTADAWTIRALAKAEAPIRRKLKQLDHEILSLTPQQEVA
jgi:CRISPR system Cascade subunit CasA